MTNSITLEALGITKDQILSGIIDKLSNDLWADVSYDEDGNPHEKGSNFSRSIQEQFRAKVDAAVESIAAKNVLPNVEKYVENLTMQQTNKWGEKTGNAVTFVEYLVQRAEAYIKEDVSYDGKTKEQDSYNWRKNGTRIEFLIERHLQYSIEAMIKKSLAELNVNVANGLAKAVETHIREAVEKLNVMTKVTAK